MDEENPQSVTGGDPQRRRSARLSSPPPTNVSVVGKMAPPSAAVNVKKRSIVVKKIAPRKTTVLSVHNKENVLPRLSEGSRQKKPSTPGPVRATPPKKKPAMPSPILASSPPRHHNKPVADPEDPVWSQKVRRSYSRLGDQSLNNSPSPNSLHSRERMFGFDQMNTPEVLKAKPKTGLGASLSGSFGGGVNSFTSLLEGDDGEAVPDLDIPGIAMAKKKRRRRKVQQMNIIELDTLSAEMNAEFEEAEGFELVVE